MCLPSNEFAHLKVPLENILSATNNFDEENAIRDSGQLLCSGELIDEIDEIVTRFENALDYQNAYFEEMEFISSLALRDPFLSLLRVQE
ncbi:hypothetical protein Tco_0924450 [Tanacetum coccineum]|uniref:Uncharacterized protein n=1 Tax=Tanacetum coccineum TaxID=301880 RepID=A0ABQ5D3W8_9ASTR